MSMRQVEQGVAFVDFGRTIRTRRERQNPLTSIVAIIYPSQGVGLTKSIT